MGKITTDQSHAVMSALSTNVVWANIDVELAITIPALERPSFAELRGKFSWVKSIERDTSPTEAVTVTLATVLRLDETKAIDGSEYERRLARKREIILGYQQAAWLVEHQDEFPELVALLGKVYIDFPGLSVVTRAGPRRYPYLDPSGNRWVLNWHWTGRGFRPKGRVALSGK